MNSLLKPVLAATLALVLLAGIVLSVQAAQLKGKVAAVRPEKNEFVLTENFKDMTFEVTSQTKIAINGRDAGLAEMKAGDLAVVDFDRQGRKLIATAVQCTRK